MRTRIYVRVQSTWWEGGLIIEANIPVQELEGQRGEGAYSGSVWVWVIFEGGLFSGGYGNNIMLGAFHLLAHIY